MNKVLDKVGSSSAMVFPFRLQRKEGEGKGKEEGRGEETEWGAWGHVY